MSDLIKNLPVDETIKENPQVIQFLTSIFGECEEKKEERIVDIKQFIACAADLILVLLSRTYIEKMTSNETTIIVTQVAEFIIILAIFKYISR